MSRDQRPGKLKIVGTTAPVPQRRRGDRVAAPVDADDSDDAEETGETESVATPARRAGLLLPGLFLGACAIGGVAVALVRGGVAG